MWTNSIVRLHFLEMHESLIIKLKKEEEVINSFQLSILI